MTKHPAPLSSGWLDVFREGQRQSAEAHLALQRALVDSHQAYLQAFEATQAALLAAASGSPVVVGAPVQLTAPPRQLSLPPMPAAPVVVPAPAPVPAAAKGNGHGNGHAPANGHGNGHGNGNGNGNGHHKAPVLPSPSIVTPAVAKANGAADARSLLLEVVADKTGYPKESLDDAMGLESDLGIDSIKRVEILGALKDKLPGADKLDALKLAQLKTLGEIAAALRAVSGNGGAHPSPVPAAPAPTTSSTSKVVAAAGGSILPALLDVVAEKTGYPKEALSPTMALEADLGVDSIKRVEILSALKERVPALPPVDAARMAQLHTLGEIAGALEGTNGAARPF